ncbi:MAG: N-acetylmuramoyl-L-alanine amidase [Deltaproteobacteria bacterium HGW-Deltaproteobacteria-4]|nr:MAG: N-acetylmuramoyl-L-alanine amidase [Deltaproteobacteria bacterium HGW-Deltaproteobacteria-4]
MACFEKNCLRLLLFVILLTNTVAPHTAMASVLDPQAIQRPLFNAERIQLTVDYARHHYGTATAVLSNPQMIVIHFTTIPTLQKTLDFFRPARIDQQVRRDIVGGGEVNVSAHYLVDRDSTLYQLAGEDILCRHIIGFNHSAIGIENVAVNADDLTQAQLEANAALISRIVQRQPMIRYLLGHHEYRDHTLPHYQLYREDDTSYRFTDKIDPGTLFMARLRALLEERYNLRFQK